MSRSADYFMRRGIFLRPLRTTSRRWRSTCATLGRAAPQRRRELQQHREHLPASRASTPRHLRDTLRHGRFTVRHLRRTASQRRRELQQHRERRLRPRASTPRRSRDTSRRWRFTAPSWGSGTPTSPRVTIISRSSTPAQGEHAKALESYLKSLEIRRATQGERHPDVAASYNNIASVHWCPGRARQGIGGAPKRWRSASPAGERHPDVAASYHNIAAVYYDQGEHAKALDVYLKALEISLAVAGGAAPQRRRQLQQHRKRLLTRPGRARQGPRGVSAEPLQPSGLRQRGRTSGSSC